VRRIVALARNRDRSSPVAFLARAAAGRLIHFPDVLLDAGEPSSPSPPTIDAARYPTSTFQNAGSVATEPARASMGSHAPVTSEREGWLGRDFTVAAPNQRCVNATTKNAARDPCDSHWSAKKATRSEERGHVRPPQSACLAINVIQEPRPYAPGSRPIGDERLARVLVDKESRTGDDPTKNSENTGSTFT
jgi:hypothetical protein